jgi:hypothetical protein
MRSTPPSGLMSERDDAMEAAADMTELSIEPFANAAR